MAPPIRYTERDLVHGLRAAPSVKAACELMGISQGALRKRVAKSDSVALVMAWERCRDRGLANTGHRRKAA